MRQSSPKLVDAAADVVQGAVSGIPRSKIKVVVDGIPPALHDNESDDLASAGNEQLEIIQKNEVYVSKKIRDHLATSAV